MGMSYLCVTVTVREDISQQFGENHQNNYNQYYKHYCYNHYS